MNAFRYVCVVVVLAGSLYVSNYGSAFSGALQEDLRKSGSEPDVDPTMLFLRTRARFRLAPFIPTPISDEEIKKYADLLELSNAQNAYLQSLHLLYLRETVPVTGQELANLRNLSYIPDLEGWDEFEAEAAYFKERDRVLEMYIDLEKTFFMRMRSILSDDQDESMERVMWHRARIRNRLVGQYLRGARIDLAQLIDELNIKNYVKERVDSILYDYERAVSPVYVSMGREYASLRTELKRLVIEGVMLGNDPALDYTSRKVRRAAINGEREDLVADAVNLETRIREVNRRYIERFVAVLADDDGRLLKKRYLSEAYPKTVYPDKTDPAELYQWVFASSELSDDQRVMFETARNSYRSAYEDVCRKMERDFEEMQEQWARTHRTGGTLFNWYKVSMKSLWIKRWGLNRDFVKRLKALLPPEVQTEIEKVLDAYLERHERIGQQTLTPDFPQPQL